MEKKSPSLLIKHEKKPVSAFTQTGLYIHVPFCVEKCGYCDFYSRSVTPEWIGKYTESIVRAIKTNPCHQRAIDTIYFGGGTPTLLPIRDIHQIFDAVDKNFSVDSQAEITLEANPEGLRQERLAELAVLGVNRMSFGVQSAVEQELQALGRRHSPQQAERVIHWAAKYFDHISADMMLGIPYQDEKSLTKTTGFFGGLPLDHVSAYILFLEESVPLFGSQLMEQAANAEEVSGLYLQMVDELGALGFGQYEISNFCKPAGESKHNLKYWKDIPYLGIGPSAHSYFEGKRFSFSPSLEEFVENSLPWNAVLDEGEGGDVEEYLMLRLRLREGVSIPDTQQKFPEWDGAGFLRRSRELRPQELLEISEDRVAMTAKGFLLSNRITADLLFG